MSTSMKNAISIYFYFFSMVIFIFGATKTSARNIDSEEIQHHVIFSTTAYNRFKAEEMCNKYTRQFCEAHIPTSAPTSDSMKIDEIIDHSICNLKRRRENHEVYPHIALIGIGDYWVCSGSLISENFVLTAAHCANFNIRGTIDTIRLGELDLVNIRDDARTVDYSITRIIVHPNYEFGTSNNDIALLQFEGLTSFKDYIRPICLNTLNNIPDQNFTAVGWGRTSKRKTSEKLLRVDLYSQYDQKCKSSFPGFNNNSMLCVEYVPGGKNTCRGDSGGPLQIENGRAECPKVPMYTQFGITSFGSKGCGNVDTPAAYTRVSHFIPWIESIVWM